MANILFIGIEYFAYTQRIVEEMRSQGHRVSFHVMEPVDFWSKAAKRYLPSKFEKQLDRHHRAIVEAERTNSYDIVLFLQVHRMAPEIVATLRQDHHGARFVLYNWDSLNTHNYVPWLTYFDRALTFDADDSINNGMDYLPLFALPEYFAARHDQPKRFDLYFVGATATPARVRAIAALRRFAEATGLRFGTHLQCSLSSMITLARRGLWLRGMTPRSIGHREIIALMEQSRGVFDFANHRQAGYTMRFIENLCAGMKIVTANARIYGEPFYSPERFLVIDGDLNFDRIPEFLATELADQPDFEQFSLASWVRRLLG